MKKLTCEMCGSTDLIKQNGVFVCQSCGMKYSVEEAKKMMIEGTVDVQGTVKVDESDKLKNLYVLARRAIEEDNTHDAEKYYYEILLEDPNSWEATFYAMYSKVLNCRIGEIERALDALETTVETAIPLIQEYVQPENRKEAYTELLQKTLYVVRLTFGVVKEFYINSDYEDENLAKMSACWEVILFVGMVAENKNGVYELNDYFLAMDSYREVIEMLKNFPLPPYLLRKERIEEDIKKTIKSIEDDYINELKPKLSEIQKRKNNEYWKEHIDEKRKYDERIAVINTEIQNLKIAIAQYESEISVIKKELTKQLPAEKQLTELKNQQFELNQQKSQLGIFAGKQKKQLQEQIYMLQSQISDLEVAIRQQKQSIQNDVSSRVAEIESKRKPFIDNISALENEKRNIMEELSKNR